MSRKRPGLGKGLDALIPQRSDFQPVLPTSSVNQIPISRIKPNPRQPRVNFDANKLSELAISIQEHGIIQPLIVSQGTTQDEYILIAGERRLLAATEAGLSVVPVVPLGLLRGPISKRRLRSIAGRSLWETRDDRTRGHPPTGRSQRGLAPFPVAGSARRCQAVAKPHRAREWLSPRV